MQRWYLDTSVIGGYFDKEFAEWTVPLIGMIQRSEVIALISEIADAELTGAPEEVIRLVSGLPSNMIQRIPVTPEIEQLAQRYITEKVVGRTSYADCLHIAIATVNKADLLVSWNFKHIVNVVRIRGYNAVNYRLGYSLLEIRSPRDIIGT